MLLSPTLKAEVSLILVTLIAACGWMFSKGSLVEMPPWLFIGVRFLIAGLVLIVAGISSWPLLRQPKVLARCLSLGVVMTVAMLCWILGLHLGRHMGEGAFITSLGVVLVPVVGYLFFADRPPVDLAGTALRRYRPRPVVSSERFSG